MNYTCAYREREAFKHRLFYGIPNFFSIFYFIFWRQVERVSSPSEVPPPNRLRAPFPIY